MWGRECFPARSGATGGSGCRGWSEKGNGAGKPEGSPAPFDCLAGLEVQAQRKLQIAHVAGLAGDLSEGGKVGRVEAGATPIRVVGEVERLGAELHAGVLRDGKLLEEPRIDVVEAGVVDHVAEAGSLRIEGARGWLRPQQFATRIGGAEPVLGTAGAVRRDLVQDGGCPVHDPELAAIAHAAVLANARVIAARG